MQCSLGMKCCLHLKRNPKGVALLGNLSVKAGSLSWTPLAKHLSRPELDPRHHLPRSWWKLQGMIIPVMFTIHKSRSLPFENSLYKKSTKWRMSLQNSAYAPELLLFAFSLSRGMRLPFRTKLLCAAKGRKARKRSKEAKYHTSLL